MNCILTSFHPLAMINSVERGWIVEEKKVATTLRLPQSLARQLKAKCALEGRTIQEVLTEAVIDYISEEKSEEKKKPE